jgi:uncharacterized protein YggE
MHRTIFLFVLPFLVLAQNTPTRTVQAMGRASDSVKPEQARLYIGVITNGATAEEAASANATQTNTMISAVTGVLGTAGTIQTVSYSVTPRYAPGTSDPPKLTGYAANNSLQVVMTDLSLVGRVIDTANNAGANSVGGLTFELRDSDPVVQRLLTAAAQQARAHANAIATGLGGTTGAVISAVEQGSVVPTPVLGATAAPTTPIVTGTVSVQASVVITMALQ